MKQKYILLITVAFLSTIMSLTAQNRKQFDVEKFKKQKAEFIISEAGLTDNEAKAFIPLSNELMDKRFELNRSFKKEMRELRRKENKTDADYNRLIDASFDIRTQEIQLDKEYIQKFRKILSPEKIYKYQKAETKFMKNMLGGDKSRDHSSKK